MQRLPTTRAVNVLYLITMLLILVIGASVQLWSPTLGLIATEWLLILLPALVYLRLARLPVRATLRLRWPGWRLAGVSLLIGVGVWLVDSWLGTVLAALSGYSIGSPPGLFPTTPARALALFVGMAVSAPLCEEVLFRGVIQRGYARRGAGAAVIITAVMFAFYHLNLQGLLAVAPIAFVLGYLAWRSDSLVSSMLAHFANNALAVGLLTAISFRPDLPLGVPSLPAAALGAVLLGLGLFLFRRWTTAPAPAVAEPEGASRLARAWPLAAAALIVAGVAALEVIMGRFPGVMAGQRLALGPSPWPAPARWEYELRDPAERSAGRAACSVTPGADDARLRCEVHANAYELRQGLSYYSTPESDWQLTVRWAADDLRLLEAAAEQRAAGGLRQQTIVPAGEGTRLTVSATGQPAQALDLPAEALMAMEWPWRLTGLPFSVGYSQHVSMAWPERWDAELQDSRPQVVPDVLQVLGAEPLATPAGRFVAWHVAIGDQSAWYDVQAPHTLVRFQDTMFTFVLTRAE